MTRLAILVDVTKCNGCHNCFLACRDEYFGNDYSPYSAPQPLNGQYWMQVKEIERGRYPRPRLDYIAVPCQHCEEAPCMNVAADNAVYRREDGIVMIDPVKAKGQKDIPNTCPYRVIYWNEELEIPQKCTLCAHRLDQGEKMPRCVESCPTGALLFGDLDDPNSDIAKATAALKPEAYRPEFGTQPLVKYVGLPKRMIAGEVVRKDVPGECAAGVPIIIESDGAKQEIKSDSYGDFEFDTAEKNKAYRVRIELVGYAPQVFEVVTHTDIDLGEVVLEPLS
jgi:Fe-S-cluster-containing dehydrogenase component